MRPGGISLLPILAGVRRRAAVRSRHTPPPWGAAWKSLCCTGGHRASGGNAPNLRASPVGLDADAELPGTLPDRVFLEIRTSAHSSHSPHKRGAGWIQKEPQDGQAKQGG
ncbi:hypothetical protein NDU88_003826 [Pleurodeles waltl]|uniref:Uncharacterized protein n=1 Tax=Pleurodeles waltl TaxID=8319 RepID=A0AAV7TQP1_PLEWA|nr:hypothetical protein NDU88_003826 [Pleurodeles waltl]